MNRKQLYRLLIDKGWKSCGYMYQDCDVLQRTLGKCEFILLYDEYLRWQHFRYKDILISYDRLIVHDGKIVFEVIL
jgi:hypothetical protein